MITREHAHHFAAEWIAAWNAHDLEQIMAHYDDAVHLTSPVAAQLLGDPDVRGKAALRAYFTKGLAASPHLHFDLQQVLWSVRSIVLYYANQRGTHTAEFMELAPSAKVVRVVANYSG